MCGFDPQSWKQVYLPDRILTPKPSRMVPGGCPGCGVVPPSSSGHCWKEKRKNPVEPSLNSCLKAICHQLASVFKTRTQRGLCPLSRVEAIQKVPPLDSMWGWVCRQALSDLECHGSRCTKPCSSAFGSFFLSKHRAVFSTELMKMPTRVSDWPTSSSWDKVSVWGWVLLFL